MSVPAKITALQKFISKNPALADVPFIEPLGKPTSPREALAALNSGQMVPEITATLTLIGIDDPYTLAKDYYKRLAKRSPGLRILRLGNTRGTFPTTGAFTPGELVRNIEEKTKLGDDVVKSYTNLLFEMGRRMK